MLKYFLSVFAAAFLNDSEVLKLSTLILLKTIHQPLPVAQAQSIIFSTDKKQYPRIFTFLLEELLSKENYRKERMKKILLLFSVSFSMLNAQNMKVQRCADIDRGAPIVNIYIDDNSNKWVSDSKGLFLAQSPDFANIVEMPPEEWSLLSVADGNAELNLPKRELQTIMGDAYEEITTAHLDKKQKELWIGTRFFGAYQLRIEPSLELVDIHHKGNSKLRSNYIHTIQSTPDGRMLIGTDDGLMVKEGKKTDLIGKYFAIDAIEYYSRTIWVLSEGEIYEVDEKGNFLPFDVVPAAVDGLIVDIAFDQYGQLWVASDIIVRYNREDESFDLFGPAQNFTSQNVNRIEVDNEDALWVGTEDKGVYFIGEGSSLTASVLIESPLSCTPDATDASLEVRASGGEPPYDYSWTGGLNGVNPQQLGPGNYQVTVTDQKGDKVEAEVTVEDNRLALTVTQEKPASSGDANDGVGVVEVINSRMRFDYQWDNGETSRRATALSSGLHSVTVTNEEGCQAIGEVTIDEALAPLAVTLELTGKNRCNGAAEASVLAKATGGQAPYQYQWEDQTNNTEELDNLPAGIYRVTVTDAESSIAEAEITVVAPAPFSAKVNIVRSANTNSADGQAFVEPQGGTSPFTYAWDNGETENKAAQLTAGSHSVTVTDANGCQVIQPFEITEDILPLTAQIQETGKIQCAGEKTAALVVQPQGGKAPFSFKWNVAGIEGPEAEGLAAGDYQITITDAANNTFNTAFTILEPQPITASITQNASASTNEADGKATVSVEGGTGKYSYAWSNGETKDQAKELAAGTHTVTITDEAGCTTAASIEITEDILPLTVALVESSGIQCTGEETAELEAEPSGGKPPFTYQWSVTGIDGPKATGLAAGTYQITVSDAANNSSTSSITINEPQPLSATIVQEAPASTDQSDGKAEVKVAGGTGKYTYQWDNGENKMQAKALKAGTHTVTITDEAGCTTAASIEITEDILPLTVALVESGGIQCAGTETAELLAEPSGGKPPFTYQWSVTGIDGPKATGLAAGTYQITVSDAANNSSTSSITINEPQPLSATIVQEAPASTDQSDGKAEVKVAGGTGKYAYQWDNGESKAQAKGLSAGTHTVTVTDAAGCTTTASIDITEDILPLALALNETTSILCAGDNTGALSLTVNGGKTPFQYAWNTDNGTETTATGLTAGEYEVTVTDAVGNSATASVTLNAPAALTLQISQDTPASTNNADGRASAKVEGGSGTYTYQWDNGETTATAVKLAPGQHRLTVTDGNGCTAEGQIDITENILPLSVNLEQTATVSCSGEETAAITPEVKGGKPPYTYQWAPLDVSSETVSNLNAGEYTLTVTDVNGTQQVAQIAIEQPEELTVVIEKNRPATYEDSEDGRVVLQVSGGTPSSEGEYTYQWDNGETEAEAEKLQVGDHSVTVTDANGCQASVDFTTKKRINPEITASALREGQTLQVSNLYFDADSTEVRPESYPALDEIADFLKENPLIIIEVGGHTNNIPPHEYCDKLSTERAKSIATYIVQQGVPSDRVFYKGYGKREPKYTNRTEDGRRRNQRVEIKILDVG